jgi:hypothetical protein
MTNTQPTAAAMRAARALSRIIYRKHGPQMLYVLPADIAAIIDRETGLAELLGAANKMMKFYKDLSESNPGFMGRLTLQNYQQWNEAMIELPTALAKAEGTA